MSIRPSPSRVLNKRRSIVDPILALLGVLVAAGWFVVAGQQLREAATADAIARAKLATDVLEQRHQIAQKRLASSAAMLSGDQRIRQTLLEAIDEPTLVDSFGELQEIDRNALHAVLTPEGKGAAVVGAASLRGLDLSSTKLVREALAQDRASSATWFIDGKLYDVGAAVLRQGSTVKAIVVVGDPSAESSVRTVAEMTSTAIAVIADGKVQSVVGGDASDAAALAGLATGTVPSGYIANVVTLPDVTPPTKVAALAKPKGDHAPLGQLIFVPIGAAVLFALLAAWRMLR